MQKKPLELCLYAAGAGAFGLFLRWLENQLAFDEQGLAEPSAFHFMLIAFLIACYVVFWRFLRQIDRKNYYVPTKLEEALHSEVKLHLVLSFAAGFVIVVGALMLFAKSETDQYVGMLRLLAALALLTGASYPMVLLEAQREKPRLGLLCPMLLLPLLTFAVWLILSYRNNAINSVSMAYVLDMLVAIVSMAAGFRMAGFAFEGAKPSRTVLAVMLSSTLCLMSLADERYTGMQAILMGNAGQMLLYTWILLQNLKQKERRVLAKKDDGWEHL